MSDFIKPGDGERRRAVRYRVQATAGFAYDGERGVGNVLDVSVGGAYVVCISPPPVGKDVDFEVHFPTSSAISPGLTLRSKGRVVRVESNSHAGFAVEAKLDRLARRGSLRSRPSAGEQEPWDR